MLWVCDILSAITIYDSSNALMIQGANAIKKKQNATLNADN